MASLPINLFDAAVYFCLAVAVIAGFRSGLLRSLATIFGYLAAMALAVAMTPRLAQFLIDEFHMPPAQTWAVYVGIFLAPASCSARCCGSPSASWSGPT